VEGEVCLDRTDIVIDEMTVRAICERKQKTEGRDGHTIGAVFRGKKGTSDGRVPSGGPAGIPFLQQSLAPSKIQRRAFRRFGALLQWSESSYESQHYPRADRQDPP